MTSATIHFRQDPSPTAALPHVTASQRADFERDGFLILPAVFLWVFAAATALRAWLGILLPGAAMGLAIWLLRAGAA